jgi:hypothetical protein
LTDSESKQKGTLQKYEYRADQYTAMFAQGERNDQYFRNARSGNIKMRRSRDNSAGIATGYGLDSRVSIPGRGQIFTSP